MTRITFVSLCAAIWLLLGVVELVRRRRLGERYALLWLLTGAVVLLLAAWPAALERFAEAVGIAYPPTALFVVAHDSAHGALFSSKRMNSVIGHIAMLPSWHVYEAWILGHNRIHHAYTVRQGYDFVWQPYTAAEYAAMGPLGRLRHRFEWSWAGAGSYYIREVWLTKMMVFDPPARWKKAIGRDASATELAAIRDRGF